MIAVGDLCGSSIVSKSFLHYKRLESVTAPRLSVGLTPDTVAPATVMADGGAVAAPLHDEEGGHAVCIDIPSVVPAEPQTSSQHSPRRAPQAATPAASALQSQEQQPLTQLEAAATQHCKAVCHTAYQLLQQQSSFEQLSNEFALILDQDEGAWVACSGRLPGNHSKNRYMDIMPFDSNRVVLPGLSDYINASYVRDPSQHCLHPCGYIATQGPLAATVADFWRMVLVTNTSAIVMLTDLRDMGREKCASYFPQKEGEVLQLPGMRVHCVYQGTTSPCITLRQLELHCNNTGKQQWINHYHYDGWPDFGVPATTEPIRHLCHALDDCRRSGCNLVVHCSAGIGRTGTFCAIDILLQRIHWLKLQVQGVVEGVVVQRAMDIPQLVRALKKQRRGMVQTGDQFSFIYTAVMDELQAHVHEYGELLDSTPLVLPGAQAARVLEAAASGAASADVAAAQTLA